MKRIKLFLPIIAGFTLFSCSDYMDVNSSPNSPNEVQVTPNLALATAQTDSYRVIAQRMNEYGNVFMNNWGANINSFTGGYAEEFGITVSSNFYDDIWNTTYLNMGEYTKIINHPSLVHDNHKAIAKILKSYYFQYIVDLYGDVPYSQAFLGLDNLTPAYDDDQAIYRDLVVQLEDAVEMIDNPVSGTTSVGAEDVIFGGNMQKWKKFANTIKLRMLLRQSQLTDAETTAYLNDEFAELASAAFVDENVTINPGYSSGSDSRQNPWMNLMVELNKTSAGAFQYRTAFNFRRASAFIAGQLNNNPPDARRGRLFSLEGGTVVGVDQGADNDSAPPVISSLGPGLVVDNSQDGYMMLLSESLLLQAEAVHRGYLTGDAQSLFDAAITSSYDQLGATGAAAYIAAVNVTAGKGYTAGTADQQLEAIFYQKSIALNGIHGAEIFIEYTRARKGGIPLIDANIPMPITAVQANKPRTLMYPLSEYASNGANVPTRTASSVFTTGPFWFAP